MDKKPISKVSRGKYVDGLLNCNDCILTHFVDGLGESVLEGSFRDGKPIGEIRIYKDYSSSKSYPGSDDKPNIELKSKLKYNQNGQLNGIQKINETTNLYFTNDRLDGFVVFHNGKRSSVRDSIFRDSYLNIVEEKLVKNESWVFRFEWSELIDPWEFSFNYSDEESPLYPKIFFGSNKFTYENGVDNRREIGFIFDNKVLTSDGLLSYNTYERYKVDFFIKDFFNRLLVKGVEDQYELSSFEIDRKVDEDKYFNRDTREYQIYQPESTNFFPNDVFDLSQFEKFLGFVKKNHLTRISEIYKFNKETNKYEEFSFENLTMKK